MDTLPPQVNQIKGLLALVDCSLKPAVQVCVAVVKAWSTFIVLRKAFEGLNREPFLPLYVDFTLGSVEVQAASSINLNIVSEGM